MSSMQQRTVELLIRLHPRSFRRRFGGEMLLDCRELLFEGASARLLLDVARSLATQWLKEVHSGRTCAAAIPGGPRFLTNQPALSFTTPLTPFELARGCMFSVLLFSLFSYAESPMRDRLGTSLLAYVRTFLTGATDAPTTLGFQRIIVTDVTVLDLERGALSAPKDVVVNDGIITAIFDATKRAWPDAQVVDGRGKFLMPGMWDMHTHIKHPEVDFPLYIANGVLGIRSMGGEQDKVFAWDARLKDGSLLGPLAFVSGPILDGPGGPVEPKSYGVFIANKEQGEAEVDTLKAKGADFVKVYDALSRESYFAIAAESKKVRLPFAGHVPNDVTILEAVHAGQRSIEHGIEHRGESTAEEELIARRKTDDYMAEAMRTHNYTLIPEGIAREGNFWKEHFSQQRADDLYRALAKNGTYLCPTLVTERWGAFGDEISSKPDARQQYIDPGTLVYWQPSMNMLTKYRTPAYKKWFETKYKMLLQQIPKQQALGVQLLAGTDLTIPFTYPGSSVHDEIRLFAEAGLTPLQALQTATTRPVAFFGMQQNLGSVSVGKKAELVLLDGNPLQGLDNLDRISAVLTHSKVLLRPELDRMMSEAASFAQNSK